MVRWIPCEIEMPEKDARVITWHYDPVKQEGYVGMRYYVLDYFDDVTHWMSLPASPDNQDETKWNSKVFSGKAEEDV